MIALIIALTIIGLILFILELLVFAGIGLSGILGGGCVIASCVLSFIIYGYFYGIISIIINLILVGICLYYILRSKTWKKATLNTNINSKVDTSPNNKGIKVGDKGITITRLALGGQAKIGENFVEVFSRDTLINNNKEIEVTHIEDNKIFVKARN